MPLGGTGMGGRSDQASSFKLQVFNGLLNDHEELVLVDFVSPFGLS